MKSAHTLLLVIGLILSSCQENTADKKTSPEANSTSIKSDKDRIEILDFYGTHRCVTCIDIEANTKYTVEKYFAEEEKSGLISFKTINADDDTNYELAEKYEASGTALFLNIVKDGKEKHIDLTDFAFSKANDKEVFSKELKSKIEKELKGL